MGTYVLHEHTFAVKGGDYPFSAEAGTRDEQGFRRTVDSERPANWY